MESWKKELLSKYLSTDRLVSFGQKMNKKVWLVIKELSKILQKGTKSDRKLKLQKLKLVYKHNK